MQITDIRGSFKLNNGIDIPYFGIGTWQSKNNEEVINSVLWSLEHGYRHIDTAAIYRNEEGVGIAMQKSGIERSDIFLTSKVWNGDQGYESTLDAFEASLKRLNTDYLDLYLIHWPVKGKYIDTWKALEKLYEEGRIRSIGVSNFLQHHLEDLMNESSIVPMVNQVEFHPRLVQQSLLDFCTKHDIQYEAWSPLMRGKIFDIPEMEAIAASYNKNAVQLVLRWNLQKGVVTIPKSINKERIIANSAIFDFEISGEDMKRIDALDLDQRVGPDPDNFDF